MKIITNKYTPWAGAINTYNTIIENDCEEELFPDGIEETKLNDLLWFEPEFIFEGLGLKLKNKPLYVKHISQLARVGKA